MRCSRSSTGGLPPATSSATSSTRSSPPPRPPSRRWRSRRHGGGLPVRRRVPAWRPVRGRDSRGTPHASLPRDRLDGVPRRRRAGRRRLCQFHPRRVVLRARRGRAGRTLHVLRFRLDLPEEPRPRAPEAGVDAGGDAVLGDRAAMSAASSIEAGAGTGKTTRVVRLLLQSLLAAGTEPSRLLALTFTVRAPH